MPQGGCSRLRNLGFLCRRAILILCVLYTTLKVKEWSPEDYARYNGELVPKTSETKEKSDWLTLLEKAPSTFWRVGLVQFFLLGGVHVHVGLCHRCYC